MWRLFRSGEDAFKNGGLLWEVDDIYIALVDVNAHVDLLWPSIQDLGLENLIGLQKLTGKQLQLDQSGNWFVACDDAVFKKLRLGLPSRTIWSMVIFAGLPGMTKIDGINVAAYTSPLPGFPVNTNGGDITITLHKQGLFYIP